MVRTQIQMTEDQVKRLKKMASVEHRSMADLIRQAVDCFVAKKAGADIEKQRDRAIALAGSFHSGADDLSKAHDKYLAEAYGK
ncbi:MAG: ribbon-helix-helix protein, CopG family [Thermodesulfobacteriota bacterium]